MSLNNILANVRNWTEFSVRTVGYGVVACVGGPMTSDRRFSRWSMRRWSGASLASMGIGVDVVGRDLLQPERQCIYVANHLSLLDILVIGVVLDGDYRWLAKHSLLWVPLLGWHLYLSGHLFVHRGKNRSRNKDLPSRMAAVVAEGASLFFFPEGTRSDDGQLKGFRIGAFRAAVDLQLPVVPLIIEGTEVLMHKGSPGIAEVTQRCRVTVREEVAPPTAGDDPDRAARELRDRVHQVFRGSLGV